MAKPLTTVFGFWERINDEIYRQNRTKLEIAKQCGFDRKILSSYSNLSIVNLARLCSALNVSADYLLFGKTTTH